MCKKLIALLLALLMLTSVMSVQAAKTMFTDVPASHWGHKYIEEMAEAGIVTGAGDGTFGPGTKLTIAQFAVMVVKAFDLDDHSVSPSDFPIWYGYYMHCMLENDLLLGLRANAAYTRDGDIEIWNHDVMNTPMTREDMAVVMYNYLKQEIALPSEADLTVFTFAEIPDLRQNRANLFYQMAIASVYELGALSGTDAIGTFSGFANMSRAEACVALSNMLRVVEDGDRSNPGAQWTDKVDARATDWSYLGLAPEVSAPVVPAAPSVSAGESLYPGTAAEYLANGKPASAENILEAIYALKSIYPEGMPCDDWNFRYDLDEEGYINYTGCAGFAYRVRDQIFGKRMYYEETYSDGFFVAGISDRQVDWNRIYPGDIITSETHKMVVLEVHDDYIVVVEGNNAGKVHWGRQVSKAHLMKDDLDPYSLHKPGRPAYAAE